MIEIEQTNNALRGNTRVFDTDALTRERYQPNRCGEQQNAFGVACVKEATIGILVEATIGTCWIRLSG